MTAELVASIEHALQYGRVRSVRDTGFTVRAGADKKECRLDVAILFEGIEDFRGILARPIIKRERNLALDCAGSDVDTIRNIPEARPGNVPDFERIW